MSELLDSKGEDYFSNRLALNWKENTYYRDGYRIMIAAVKIFTLIAIILALLLLYLCATITNKDRYFAETIEGQKMQMVGMSYPNLGRGALADWAAQAVVQIMTFGFNDIDQSFDISKNNFTKEGWEAFRGVAVSSKLIEGVMDNQQIVTASPYSVPVLIQEGLFIDVYKWIFEMDIMLTFRSGSTKQNNIKHLRVVIERTPTAQNPMGVGISEWYMY